MTGRSAARCPVGQPRPGRVVTGLKVGLAGPQDFFQLFDEKQSRTFSRNCRVYCRMRDKVFNDFWSRQALYSLWICDKGWIRANNIFGVHVCG